MVLASTRTFGSYKHLSLPSTRDNHDQQTVHPRVISLPQLRWCIELLLVSIPVVEGVEGSGNGLPLYQAPFACPMEDSTSTEDHGKLEGGPRRPKLLSIRGNGVCGRLLHTSVLFNAATTLHAQNHTPLWLVRPHQLVFFLIHISR
jgi:hypothetical protein